MSADSEKPWMPFSFPLCSQCTNVQTHTKKTVIQVYTCSFLVAVYLMLFYNTLKLIVAKEQSSEEKLEYEGMGTNLSLIKHQMF